ncbi:hypothetical protein Tco_0335601 [Tanacetum coccineum]
MVRNDCMSSDNLCVSNAVNVVKSRAKPKKNKSKKDSWKPTGKVFTQIGYIWRPTGRTFTIVGNACPLTRITTTYEGDSRENSIVLDSEYPNLWLIGCPNRPLYFGPVARTTMNGRSLSAQFRQVYYVEGLGHNLFSVGQFCDSNLEVAFRQHTCFIRNLEGVKNQVLVMASSSLSFELWFYQSSGKTWTCTRTVPNPSPANTFVPPSRSDWDLLFQPMFDEVTYFEPKNYQEALTQACWDEAMREDNFMTFEVGGGILKNKARLVARGYRQEEGLLPLVVKSKNSDEDKEGKAVDPSLSWILPLHNSMCDEDHAGCHRYRRDVENGVIELNFVKYGISTGGIFTKALAEKEFEFLSQLESEFSAGYYMKHWQRS